MEATHLVISIEGTLAIAVAIVGGAFGIYRESANAHAEFRSILAAQSEKFNASDERFGRMDERFNAVQAQIKSVDDKVDKLGNS